MYTENHENNIFTCRMCSVIPEVLTNDWKKCSTSWKQQDVWVELIYLKDVSSEEKFEATFFIWTTYYLAQQRQVQIFEHKIQLSNSEYSDGRRICIAYEYEH